MTLRHRAKAARRDLSAAGRIPFAAQVAPAVVRTVAGDYVQTFRMLGAAFESRDHDSLNHCHERLNVLWRNIAGPHVALWAHIIRHRARLPERSAPVQDRSGFAHRLAQRYRERLSGTTLMQNDLYLSVLYRPAAGLAAGLLTRIRARTTDPLRWELDEALESCAKLAETVAASLARYEPELLQCYRHGAVWCSAQLEFFALLVNGEPQRMPLPKGPLNHAILGSRLLIGNETVEQRRAVTAQVGAMLGIKEYPTPTSVGMFNRLLCAPFSFVLTQSFTFLTKSAAQALLQRQFNRMANAGDFAVSQAVELKDALDALTSNEFVMGDHHFSLYVTAELPVAAAPGAIRLNALNDAVGLARAWLADTGMLVAREDLALDAAFWAQLPGNFACRPRKAPITSRNWAGMMPLHNYPKGSATGNHWGDALCVLVTNARSPYHFSLHAGNPADSGGGRKDTGHTLVCGPTGSGKTVFVGFMVSMLARQEVTQVIIDKDRGLEILVRALGGDYFALCNGMPTGFNPLQLPDTPANAEFLKKWLRMLCGLHASGAANSARAQADLDQALLGTLALDLPARRLSRLVEFLDRTETEGVHARLSPWCASRRGEYAWAFDNPEDTLIPRLAACVTLGFDVTEFLDNAMVRSPITLYLFHLVRQMLDGRRLVCWMDEFWRLLADPGFEHFAKDGPKTWRKLNGVMCLATQSTGDVLDSPISRTLIEQTPTKVFFPNVDALEEDYVGGFGLTAREFHLVKDGLEPGSRQFLIKQGHQSVVCELDLHGFDADLAVISGRAIDVARMHQIIDQVGPNPADWLPVYCRK